MSCQPKTCTQDKQGGEIVLWIVFFCRFFVHSSFQILFSKTISSSISEFDHSKYFLKVVILKQECYFKASCYFKDVSLLSMVQVDRRPAILCREICWTTSHTRNTCNNHHSQTPSYHSLLPIWLELYLDQVLHLDHYRRQHVHFFLSFLLSFFLSFFLFFFKPTNVEWCKICQNSDNEV